MRSDRWLVEAGLLTHPKSGACRSQYVRALGGLPGGRRVPAEDPRRPREGRRDVMRLLAPAPDHASGVEARPNACLPKHA